MVENTKNPIRIDLNEFKLHIHLKNRIQLTLYFNSPSRKFYLSVIALVVNEMKRLGRVTSIPMEGHLGLLVLLNETIGESAGSSDMENLLPRIYRKWKDTLPDLENAHLFKILGRRKEYDEGMGRTYPFAETEKDNWANLFDYHGSEENVRLKFAVDRVGATLDDIVILYEDLLNGEAWEKFISNLKRKGEHVPKAEAIQSVGEVPKSPESQMERQKSPWQGRRRWAVPVALIVVITAAGALATWKLYLKPIPDKKASVEKMAFPLPDKPSIAVLPFVNMSEDPKQEFFSDGMTEEIITALSKSPELFIIARNSTFAYKGKAVGVKQVSEELGVRYVLEGSIRREGNRVRITANFIDALTGYHLWTEQYDREIKEVLALQAEIALKIMTALHVKLQRDDARVMARGVKNLEAYLKAMEGREQFNRGTKEGNTLARKLAEEAIALEADYARGYWLLAATHSRDILLGTTKYPKESLERAIELTKKAIALDPSDGNFRSSMALLYARSRQWDKGFPEVERALALEPNSPEVLFNSGVFLNWAGKPEEAVPLLKESIRLNPFAPAEQFRLLSAAYCQTRRHEEAIEMAKLAVQRAPESHSSYVQLAAVLSAGGRDDEARAAAAQVLKINPKFSLEQFAGALAFKNQAHSDYMIDALRKAGLK
jgi:TolB-like protein/Flp pilus assembly protein TadD